MGLAQLMGSCALYGVLAGFLGQVFGGLGHISSDVKFEHGLDLQSWVTRSGAGSRNDNAHTGLPGGRIDQQYDNTVPCDPR